MAFGIYGAVGLQLAITVVAGLYIGSLIDKKLETEPWLTLVGLVIGAVGGFYNLVRILNWKGQQSKGEK